MSMPLEEVRQLAELARIELQPQEERRFAAELDRILEYVGRLSEVKTEGVPETEAGLEAHALRSDEPVMTDDVARELILSHFPDRNGDLLRVPAVFEKPKGASRNK